MMPKRNEQETENWYLPQVPTRKRKCNSTEAGARGTLGRRGIRGNRCAQRKRRHRTRPASSRGRAEATRRPLPHSSPPIPPFASAPLLAALLKYAPPTCSADYRARTIRSESRRLSCTLWARAWMGGPCASSGRRRWSQRSCRTGGSGVVRRTVAAPAPAEGGASAASRRTVGFAHVDKQQRVHGVLSDSRSCSGSTTEEDYFCSNFWEFKRKRSSGNSTRCPPSEHMRNEIESYHSLPSVIAELTDFVAATEMPITSVKTSFSWPRENKIPSNEKLLRVSSTDSNYGLPYRPKFHIGEDSNNVKHAPPQKNSSGMGNFSYRLARSAERSDSMKMGPTSAKCSFSEKMSLLRQPGHGHSYENQNHIGALNRRHKIAHSGGATNMTRKEEVHKQSDSSTGRHWQALLDNALVRRNQLYCSQPPNEELSEQLWSSTNSESSDTSDISKLSSLGIVANDQWKLTFKKVLCPVAARMDSMSVTNCKEFEQPSPVSVLEPPAEDLSCGENIKLDRTYPHDPQLRLKPVKFPCMETVAEVVGISGISDYLCSEIETGQNDEAIQLVEDILEEFGDEEEREFSYLLDILIASGIHGTEEDQLYKVCQSLDCPASYDVFEKLEKKYMKVSQWSRSDRKLIFDMVNSILSEILAPCLDMHPWVNTARNLVPMWGPEGLLEKVLQMLAQRREELALSKPKPEKKAFDQKWPDLADCIDKAGRDVEKMIKDDLLEELLLELMSR